MKHFVFYYSYLSVEITSSNILLALAHFVEDYNFAELHMIVNSTDKKIYGASKIAILFGNLNRQYFKSNNIISESNSFQST